MVTLTPPLDIPGTATAALRRSRRTAALDISSIVQLTERVAVKRAASEDVIALSTGEPDFGTPAHVIEAANRAALEGKTRYPPTAGTAELRAAVARSYDTDPQRVVISTGAKQVIANAMIATLDPGDEVILPTPFWTSYVDIVTLAGGRPVKVETSAATGFTLQPHELDKAITPRTRWLFLNAPSNPSGAIFSREQLRALAEVLGYHPQIMVLADEIYELLNYVPFVRFGDAAPELVDRTLTVNGVSKAYAMTGWRIGWGVGPQALISAMVAVQGQFTSGASSISQAAALAAIEGDQSLIGDRREALRARRDRVVATLNSLPRINCPSPDGAFYLFPDFTSVIQRLELPNDQALCDYLIDAAGVALVPGSAFGASGHIRISFAYSDNELDTAICRLADFLEDHL